MNIHVTNVVDAKRDSRVGLAIADGDIHPNPKNAKALHPYLSKRWQQHLDTYGLIPRHAYQAGPAYPKGMPDASRRDSYPDDGTYPGSNLDLVRSQHLDANNVEMGVLNPIRPAPGNAQNLDLSAVLARAINEWQVAEWAEPEPRLKASIAVPYEDAAASVAEIEHWAGNSHFIQVLMMSRTAEPMGQRRYWPIFEAAARNDLPIGIHAFGYGGYPISGGGWPSFYLEEMSGHAQCCQSLLTSLIFEGVFERFPTLRWF